MLSTLQLIWFGLLGVLLAGYAVLDGYDLGVGMWHLAAKGDRDRRTLLAAISPFWDGNEVWLLTGGGALFAAFAPAYATVFSGLYLALVLVLVGLIFRAIAIEFRNQVDSEGWRKRWDVAFAFGSAVPSLLFGVALGNMVRGLELDAKGDYIGGFFALLNPYALLVGVAGVAMLACHGALYIAVKTEGELQAAARRWAAMAWLLWAPMFVLTTLWGVLAYGRGPLWLVLVGVLLAASAIVAAKVFLGRGRDLAAFLASAVGIVAVFFAVGANLYPNLVPGLAGNDITIYSHSASEYTLLVMVIVAGIGMPLVIGYTAYIHRAFAGKVRLDTESSATGYG
jgi:cytochrome d ubiquinol oxidase subunit II